MCFHGMCECFQVFGAQLSILRGLISDCVMVVVVPGTLVPELHPLSACKMVGLILCVKILEYRNAYKQTRVFT